MKKAILILNAIMLMQFSFAQTFTNYSTADGLISNNVQCVYANSSSDIWFGTQLGVSQFDGATWTTYEMATYPGMADDNILSIYVDGLDQTWIGTDFGTSFFNGATWTTYTTADGLDNNKVQCINQDAEGNMWFGTINGLSKFDGASWTTFGTGDGLPFGGINSITLHSDGDLWFGTGLGGIAIYDGTDFIEITEDEGLISDKIRAIEFAPDGKSWVATAEGLSTFDAANTFLNSHTTIFTIPDPDTLNPIVDVKIDGNGVVWAGVYVDYLVTEGGVCAYNGSTWFEFDVSDGLAGPVVNGLSIDDNNDVWVATSTGITKISDHTLATADYKQISFSTYPNPTMSELTISFDNVSSQATVVELYTISMRQVSSYNVEPNESILNINLESLENGIYLLMSQVPQIWVLVIMRVY